MIVLRHRYTTEISCIKQLNQYELGKSKLLGKVVTFLPNLPERFKKVVDELDVVTQSQVNKARGILRELVGEEDSTPCVVKRR